MSADSNSDSLVIVALGSNLGDSERLLRDAFARLASQATSGFQHSSLWTSEPVDCPPGSPPFLNAVAVWLPRPGESPESLILSLQRCERELGRRSKVVMNEPRPIDLDLIAFARERRDRDELTIPHPRAHLRRFVLAPLAEITPDYQLPGQAHSIASLLSSLPTEPKVMRLH